jgi:AcrR family transcriptional regulator
MAETKRRILDTARALFNAEGLHRVGVRDIARATGMSPGNLAYHFPTKDTLVSALVRELHEHNARAFFGELPTPFSLVTLYGGAVIAMRNILSFRFVVLSYVDAVTASPELQGVELSLREKRRLRMDAMTDRLVKNGYLDEEAFAQRAAIVREQGELLSSAWLTAEAIYPSGRDDEGVVLHYAKLGCALLESSCTPKGARQMRRILAGGHDEGLWASAGAVIARTAVERGDAARLAGLTPARGALPRLSS